MIDRRDRALAPPSMPMQKYVIRSQGALWQIWLDDVLVGTGPAQMHAVHLALHLARAAAHHGQRSKIMVAGLDGSPIELPIVEPWGQSAAGTA